MQSKEKTHEGHLTCEDDLHLSA